MKQSVDLVIVTIVAHRNKVCSQEEERIKASHGGSLNYVKKKKKVFPPKQNSPSKPQNKLQGKAPVYYQPKPITVDKDT